MVSNRLPVKESRLRPHVSSIEHQIYCNTCHSVQSCFICCTLVTSQNKDLQRQLAETEADNARMATKGSETIEFGKGTKPKTPRSSDKIDLIDDFDDKMDTHQGELVQVMKETLKSVSAAGTVTESPSSKMRRSTLEINKVIASLMDEKKELEAQSEDTTDVQNMINFYRQKRKAVCNLAVRNLEHEY